MKKIFCCVFLLISGSISSLQGQNIEDLPQQEETGYSTSVEARRLWREMTRSYDERIARERGELERRENELRTLEAIVDQKITQLRQERQNLEQLFAQKDTLRQKQLKNLSRIYENMAADKAAILLSALDQELSIDLLERMHSKSAAKILGNMDKDKALRLSEALSSLK